jgi:hypothetical protein
VQPEIDAYLREHGAKYTTKALRAQLITAGYDAAEVDAALQETEQARAPQFAATRSLRSRFWRWAFIVHAVALGLVIVWVLQGSNAGVTGIVAVVLGIFLLLGLGISGLIGGALLGRGLAVALIVPIISAILLGGTCAAMMGGPVII